METSRNIVMKKFEAENFRSPFFDEFLFLLIRMSPSLYLEGIHFLMFLQHLEPSWVHFLNSSSYGSLPRETYTIITINSTFKIQFGWIFGCLLENETEIILKNDEFVCVRNRSNRQRPIST